MFCLILRLHLRHRHQQFILTKFQKTLPLLLRLPLQMKTPMKKLLNQQKRTLQKLNKQIRNMNQNQSQVLPFKNFHLMLWCSSREVAMFVRKSRSWLLPWLLLPSQNEDGIESTILLHDSHLDNHELWNFQGTLKLLNKIWNFRGKGYVKSVVIYAMYNPQM